MFKKIIVPLDGSEVAENVLPYVHTLTLPGETELYLIRNIELSAYAFGAESPTMMTELLDSISADAQTYLARHKDELQARGYCVTTRLTRGDTASSILQLATEQHAELIAMTTHGRTGVGRATLGSVADRVLRSADVPVLLVRDAAGASPGETLRQILVPLDGSDLSEQALPLARLLARELDSRILLLRSVESLDDVHLARLFEDRLDEHDVPSDWYNEAQVYLNQMQKNLQFANIPSEIRVVIGQPAQAILDAAAAEPCDLIVMSTHGRSGLSRWVYGSVTSKVLHETTCPLLIVRAHVREEVAEVEPRWVAVT